MTSFPPRPAGALLALAALLALTAQSPEPVAAAQSWCTRIPLPQSARGPACRPLEIRAGRTTLRLAVASTEKQRERGLMNVKRVPPGQGMIFAFPGGDELRGFWMKDTITPLDMVFVRGDGTIVMIAVNVPASSLMTPDDKVARRQAVAKYVIELGAHDSERIGLEPGMQLFVPPVEAQ